MENNSIILAKTANYQAKLLAEGYTQDEIIKRAAGYMDALAEFASSSQVEDVKQVYAAATKEPNSIGGIAEEQAAIMAKGLKQHKPKPKEKLTAKEKIEKALPFLKKEEQVKK